ncbi:MAG: hypothetical protein V3574_00980 [Candidatus Moraniibacteriota bacterium]
MRKRTLLAVAVLFILGAIIWIWPNFKRDKEVIKIQPPQIISLKIGSGPDLKIISKPEKNTDSRARQ